jgi:hypothetical protein
LTRAFDGLTKWDNQKFAIEQIKAQRYGEGRYEFDETMKRGRGKKEEGDGDGDAHLDEIDNDVVLHENGSNRVNYMQPFSIGTHF